MGRSEPNPTERPGPDALGEESTIIPILSLSERNPSDFQTRSEKIYSTLAILMGSVIVATIFGNISILLANFTSEQTQYQKKME